MSSSVGSLATVLVVLLYYSSFVKRYEMVAGHILPPPCPRNYMFSCQPTLQPVPCDGLASSIRQPYAPATLPLTATIPIYTSAAQAAAEPLPLPPTFTAPALHSMPPLPTLSALPTLTGLTNALSSVTGCSNPVGSYTHNVPVYVQPANILPPAEAPATAPLNTNGNNLNLNQHNNSNN